MYGIHLFLHGSTLFFYIPVHYFNLRAGGQGGAGYGDKGGRGGGRGAGAG